MHYFGNPRHTRSMLANGNVVNMPYYHGSLGRYCLDFIMFVGLHRCYFYVDCKISINSTARLQFKHELELHFVMRKLYASGNLVLFRMVNWGYLLKECHEEILQRYPCKCID